MKQKIKLIHLKTSAGMGGAEVMLTYWATYLDKDRFEQIVIFAEDGPLLNKMENLGVEVYCIPGLKNAMGLAVVPKLIRMIRGKKINLIHAHGARVNLWGSMASMMTGVPIVATEHSIDLWRKSNNLFNMIDRFSARINKFRVGVSFAVCEMLIKSGIPKNKIVCIENGIDAKRFDIKVNLPAKKAEFGLSMDTKVIGTVGRLVDQKGHKYLIDAARGVSDKYPDTRFIIVGDGPLKKALESQVDRLGLKRKVIFTGQREDIPELMAIMDIFVLPSITEGLPLVLLEAMASGKPVVASRVSGIPNVINDGVDGILSEPSDSDSLEEKIRFLISNQTVATLMGEKAKKKAIFQYDAQNMIKRYCDLYIKVLSEKK